jgi:hypothetical protein
MKEIVLKVDHSEFYLKKKQLVITLENAFKNDLNKTKFTGYAPSEVHVIGNKYTIPFRLFNVDQLPAEIPKDLFPLYKGCWWYRPFAETKQQITECDGYYVIVVNIVGDLKAA